MISTETTAAEASRRAELLTARYAALTEGDPNVDYHWHREASQEQLPDTDSVPAALGAGRARFGDLVRLAADDRTFQLWRLRLEHPLWWIGGPVVDTTAFLAEIVGDLAGESSGSGSGPHPGATGFPGAHWFTSSKEAIAPLTQPTRAKLAEALGRELLGRKFCRPLPALLVDVDERPNTAEVFPEAEFGVAVDGERLAHALDAATAIHGTQWAEAFLTMLGELDLVTWDSVIEALFIEVQQSAR